MKNYNVFIKRCGEFAYFLFHELSKEKIFVNWNLFCEKHGKSSRDQHFSVISNFLTQESLEKKLTCSNDIVEAIKKRQRQSNLSRFINKFEPILYWVGELPEKVNQNIINVDMTSENDYFDANEELLSNSDDIIDDFDNDSKLYDNETLTENKHSKRFACKIEDLKIYYNLQTKDSSFQLFSTIFSDLETLIEIKSKVIEVNSNTTGHSPELKVKERETNVDGIRTKVHKIRSIFQKNKLNIDNEKFEVPPLESALNLENENYSTFCRGK